LVVEAIKKYDIDPQGSFMIGDKICDIELAANARLNGILLTTGHGLEESKKVLKQYPNTPVLPNFKKAVEFIVQHGQRRRNRNKL